MVAEGLLSDVEQTQSSSTCRLTGRDCFPYRIVATQKKEKRPSSELAKYNGNLETGTKKLTTLCCQKCGISVCVGECFENLHLKRNYSE
jgi:hypothetical protein